jgi:hypothetical protein
MDALHVVAGLVPASQYKHEQGENGGPAKEEKGVEPIAPGGNEEIHKVKIHQRDEMEMFKKGDLLLSI